MTYRDRIDAPGPKKLLALDGGGIRGVITLEVLARIERQLRRRSGRDDLVLSDYFDYIGGTSTGAISAAGLALGMPVRDLQVLYASHGEQMFDRNALWEQWKSRYSADRLQTLLQRTFGSDTRFGSERLRTLLMMVLRNASTDSPWPLSNNPRAKFSDPARDDNNLLLPLWQLVRASTAAPVFFPPEQIHVGSRRFVFVDGALTMYNNPAFQLFLMATLDVYRLCWEASEDAMLVVSVGTGTAPKADDHLRPNDMNLLYNASSVPAALIYGASNEQDLLCRVFGRCRHGAEIDLEVGDLRTGRGVLDRRMFTYLRYNADLSAAGLAAMGLADINPEEVQKLDSVRSIGDLQRIGMRLADEVLPEHFAGFPP